MKTADQAREALVHVTTKPAHPVGKRETPATVGVPNRLRLLKWNEVVCRGDFVADEHQGFELWEGPAGFRADAFVKPIYRRNEDRSTVTKK